ncbi:ATP-binding protein [Paenibacillus sp. QZ-Y1]|uniref:HAMP domain-containing sensor histidine kinase n=1 Tax=Paenibacillus sp. QZ-Y1 TaxID=3414511 RepID=UPI003F79E08C
MIEVLRNPEWKSITIKVLGLQVLLSFMMFFYMHHQVESINTTIVNQNSALIGHLLMKEPQLENEVIHFITQGAQTAELAEGQRILAQYGYQADMPLEDQPALSGRALPLKTAAQVLLFLIPLMVLLLWEYRKLFVKIRTISHAAEQVVENQFDKQLPETEDGDFGSLGRSFNAMAGRLTNSLELLQQEKTFLRNLLSDISHQLKTPLASLIVFNENLLNDPGMKEEMRMKFLERSRQQLDQMEWLIISLLKLARVEAGAIRFRTERIKLRELIESAVYSLRTAADQKRQTITILGSENAYVQADEEWLKEAVMNLIKNALEHTPPEGEVRINLEENSLFNTIVIQDNGEGIHPDDIPHIFKRFYKGKNHNKPHSIGIGLALTKSIIEEQNGIITVESALGEGTTFRISFFKRE